MFKRYWRDYPWFLQLLLFLLVIFIFGNFFIKVVTPISLKFMTGSSFVDIENLTASSSVRDIRAALYAQALFHMSIFLIPALMFSYTTHPRVPFYLGLRRPGRSVQWVLVALTMLGAIPIMLQMDAWMHHINVGKDLGKVQEQMEQVTNAFLTMPTFADFIFVFVVMAVLPALGEEMLFRGILFRFAARRSRISFMPVPGDTSVMPELKPKTAITLRHMAFPIFITALMFTALHSNVYGFFSIFFAGVLLGLIYYWTRSLWCCILAHVINNGLQIVLIYVFRNNKQYAAVMESNQLPVAVVIGGFLLFSVSFYLLWKNRTPLTVEHISDFTSSEIAAIKAEND